MPIKESYRDAMIMNGNEITILYNKEHPPDKSATALCHELGHAILKDRLSNTEAYLYYLGRTDFRYIGLRHEIEATRLAKSICKPNLWNENFALHGLHSHFCPPGMWRAYTRPYANKLAKEWKKFKKIGIIPYYRPRIKKSMSKTLKLILED